MQTKLAGVVALHMLLTSLATFASEDCGKVTIADMNWSSATLIAHIDQFILTHGFGCNAELVPGDTMPTSTSMIERGEPDIAPELWTISMKEALEKGVKEKRLRYAGKAFSDGGEEGFWVPQYLVDKNPSLATIKGVLANAKLFKHPEDPDKSAFYGCPAGWNCQITSSNLFKALELEDAGFDLIDPGSAAGLDGSIARAHERNEPWFGYYWSPTAIVAKYKMVKVDFGSGVNEEHYANCLSKTECEDPKVSMYPSSPVYTVTTHSLATAAPKAYSYLEKRSFTKQQINELLVWMDENQADGEVVMEHFLTNYEIRWTTWLPKVAVEKIKKVLNER
ncbi:MAG: ABC transporter substrate-binding protein [Methylococcaceae bacterium]